MKLLPAFLKQMRIWIEEEQPWPNNIWVKGSDGELYIRFVFRLNRLDLANFNIKSKFRGRGVARSIIEAALLQPVRTIRIESLLHGGWGDKLKNYRFDGFLTNVIPQGDGDIQFNIDFTRQK